ncbi:hypothetical protein [Allosphingosinicella sp.]|jgi:hypothetical protein|uniref:hypothetical protein n=1 Tax=Allosphingosinicella sp. TaxID=2823234 RepID=UPI002EE189A5
MRRANCAALAALLAGCASVSPPAEELSWYYRDGYGTGDPERPIGLYGLPETSAFYIFECVPHERALEIISVDVEEFAGARPIAVRVGNAEWRGVERMDPPDGQAMSRASIPLGHPVLDAVAAGRGPIRVDGGRLSGGEVPARVVRECRALAERLRPSRP